MRILITGLVLFLVWAGLSSWFYVCQVKGLCAGEMEAEEVPVPGPSGEEIGVTGDSLSGELAREPAVCTVYFHSDQWSFEPDPDLQSGRDQYKVWTGKEPGTTIRIVGHTDATGSESYNLDLGKKRAEAVRDFFAAGGIPRDRIKVVSRGENEPVADNQTRQGRAKNRRVEVSINN